jgi:two-component system, sensor histidine kinase and response regulator
MVVDDNQTSREIFQEMLESFSFEVTLAASGEEGLAEIAKSLGGRPYDLVIMDWMMPGMDGIKAAERIKHDSSLTRIPAIILVTAYGREEIIRQAEAAGLDGFLIKPVSPSVMFDTIMQAFGKEAPRDLRLSTEKDQASQAMKGLAGARVLLVEDNEINQQVAMEILAGAGLDVSIANNGQEAVAAVQANSYEAVSMDVQMPVMDGYTATRTLRSDPRFHDLPIIAMTAHAMTGDHEKSLAAGMNDHVTKPIDPAQLLATLAKWVAAREAPPFKERQPVVVPEELTAAAPADASALLRPDHRLQELGTKREEPGTRNQERGSEQPFPESLPGFDLAEGLQRLQGNKVLYRKLLLSFATGYAQTAGDLRKVLEANDYDQAHHLVHSIKGVAGNLAAGELQAAAMVLEKLVKHADEHNPPASESLNEALAAFREKLDQALQVARSLTPVESQPSLRLPVEPAGSVTPELAKEAALRLREAADLGDVTGLVAIAEELTSRSGAFSLYRSKIAVLADDFDFDGIVELVNDLEKISEITVQRNSC